MESYQKILRRLNSHPSCALEMIRKITKRRNSCCLKCGVTRRPQIHHKDKRGIITYFCPECKKTYSELYGTVFFRHSKGEFARESFIHSNTIEQIWGDIKGIIRTIHHGISRKYRHLYLAQYIFKYENLLSSNLFYNTLCQLLPPMFAGI